MIAQDVLDRVRGRIANAGVRTDPASVADAVRAEFGGVAGDADVLRVLTALTSDIAGFGPLEELLADADTTDVLVTAPDQVWVDGVGGLRRTSVRFADEDAVRRLAQRLSLAAGRRLDEAQPYVDGWLPGECGGAQVRLHAVLAPIAADGTCLSLRVLRQAKHDMSALRALGAFSADVDVLLREIVAARLAFLVIGATGAGKSTLLAALLGCVPSAERIVCVEDAGELAPAHPQFVRLVARQANIEGSGLITQRDLVRQALRMRPDRIVVGEVRGAEVVELLTAMNTGHDGGAGTLHANAPDEVPARMEALGALGGLERYALHSQLGAAVQVVLQVRRDSDRKRRLAEIAVLQRVDALVRVVPAWRDGEWLAGRSALHQMLASRGREWAVE